MKRIGFLGFGLGLACATGSDPAALGFTEGPDGGMNTASPSEPASTFGDAAVASDAFGACGTETIAATVLPLDLFVMLDASGSMASTIAGGTQKWTAVSQALSTFFSDVASTGIRTSLSFFPVARLGVPSTCTSTGQCGTGGLCMLRLCLQPDIIKWCNTSADCGGVQCVATGSCSNGIDACFPDFPNSGCPAGNTCRRRFEAECENSDSCALSDYTPTIGTLSSLPASAPALATAMNARGLLLRGQTPTGVALKGALNAALAQHAAEPNHSSAVVLVTDGLPTSCTPVNVATIAGQAEAAAMRGVKTYVMGVFSPDEEVEARINLNAIASAGGTSSAAVITTTQPVATSIVSALNALRERALPCEYAIPAPKSGTALDYGLINVERTGGGTAQPLSQVGSRGACGNQEGWFYDVAPANGTPSKISLCPSSCTAARAPKDGRVNIVLGCATRIR
jgi:hypothetical protein